MENPELINSQYGISRSKMVDDYITFNQKAQNNKAFLSFKCGHKFHKKCLDSLKKIDKEEQVGLKGQDRTSSRQSNKSGNRSSSSRGER
jgi:hypothetical protein